jgi:hypothetical protein
VKQQPPSPKLSIQGIKTTANSAEEYHSFLKIVYSLVHGDIHLNTVRDTRVADDALSV